MTSKDGKYAKRPEFIDVDNAVRAPKHYKGEYVKNLPSLGVLNPPINASYSGKVGGLPRHSFLLGGGKGDVTPIQTRNRKSPNPLEEANH